MAPDGGFNDHILLFGAFLGIISSLCCFYFIVKKLKINQIIKKLLIFASIQQAFGYGILFSSVMLAIYQIKNKLTCALATASFGVSGNGTQLVITMISIIRLFIFLLFRDGGKPDFFQNPGSGSNPGFGFINPGFPVPPIFYENVHFFSIFSNLALCVILKTKLSSSRTWFIAYF